MSGQLVKLPLDCDVDYCEHFLDEKNAQEIFDHIINSYDLKRQSVSLKDGAQYKLNRSTLVFTDEETAKLNIIPKIWGEKTPVIIWPECITKIKNKIEQLTGKTYNICLCNHYENGKRNIGWHSDNEEHGSLSSIASISLGAQRQFNFRKSHNFSEIYPTTLANGSLLIMGERCQENYQHCVPFDKSVSEPRINLTFRRFDKDRYSNK
jgi:hypothetical protein